jgi:hypothetical protein
MSNALYRKLDAMKDLSKAAQNGKKNQAAVGAGAASTAAPAAGAGFSLASFSMVGESVAPLPRQ